MKELEAIMKKVDKHTADTYYASKEKVSTEEAAASRVEKANKDRVLALIEERVLKIDRIDKPMYRLLKNKAFQKACCMIIKRHIPNIDKTLRATFTKFFLQTLFTYRLFTSFYNSQKV